MKPKLNPLVSLLIGSFTLYLLEYYGLSNFKYYEPSGLFAADLVIATLIIIWSRVYGLIALVLVLLSIVLKIISGIFFTEPEILLFSINQITFSLLWSNRLVLLGIGLFISSSIWIGSSTRSSKKSKDTFLLVTIFLILIISDVLNGSNVLSPGFRVKGKTNILYSTGFPLLRKILTPPLPSSFKKVDSALGTYITDFYSVEKRSKKRNIILITVESLGASSLNSESNFGYRELTNDYQSFSIIRRGLIPFHGSTTWAEIRERYGGEGTYPLSENQLTKSFISEFKHQGFFTLGIHSYRGSMFKRSYWWPREGFQETVFMENRINQYPLDHGSLIALNDEAMLEGEIRRATLKSPYFMYYLTSNTHFPTSEDAKKFLEEALFRLLSKIDLLVKDGTLTDTDLIIVGDHAPPIGSDIFNSTHVPYWILRTTK